MNKTNYLLGTLALSAIVGIASCEGRRQHSDSERSAQPSSSQTSSANVTYLSEYQKCSRENEQMQNQLQLAIKERDSTLKEKTELEAKIRQEEQASCEKRIASLTPPKPVEDKFLPDIDKPVHPFLKALAEGKYDYLTNLNEEKEFSPYIAIDKSRFFLNFEAPCPKEKQCVQSLSFKYQRGDGSYELEYFVEKKMITKNAQGESELEKLWGVTYEGKGQVLNYEELTKIISNEYIESKDAEHDGEQREKKFDPKQVSAEYKSVFTKQLSSLQERCDNLAKEKAKLPSPLQ